MISVAPSSTQINSNLISYLFCAKRKGKMNGGDTVWYCRIELFVHTTQQLQSVFWPEPTRRRLSTKSCRCNSDLFALRSTQLKLENSCQTTHWIHFKLGMTQRGRYTIRCRRTGNFRFFLFGFVSSFVCRILRFDLLSISRRRRRRISQVNEHHKL